MVGDPPWFTSAMLFPATSPRTFANFAAAADDALVARIYSGIHFRFAMLDARRVGEQIAAYVLEHAAQPFHGKRLGQLPD